MERRRETELWLHPHVYGLCQKKTDGKWHVSSAESGCTAGERTSGYLELAEGNSGCRQRFFTGRTGKDGIDYGRRSCGAYVGIQAAVELSAMLKPEKIAGTVILVKVINRPAFEHRSGSLGYEDHKNLNRVFPEIRKVQRWSSWPGPSLSSCILRQII